MLLGALAVHQVCSQCAEAFQALVKGLITEFESAHEAKYGPPKDAKAKKEVHEASLAAVRNLWLPHATLSLRGENPLLRSHTAIYAVDWLLKNDPGCFHPLLASMRPPKFKPLTDARLHGMVLVLKLARSHSLIEGAELAQGDLQGIVEAGLQHPIDVIRGDAAELAILSHKQTVFPTPWELEVTKKFLRSNVKGSTLSLIHI